MGWAEFEERSFEMVLYNQLHQGTALNVWTPGQCLEAYIGIDYGGYVFSNQFWNRFGGVAPGGAILNDFNMGYMWKKMHKMKMLPDFYLNLFIQAKRPYVHDGTKPDSIYSCKHYSFKVVPRQQKLLEKLNHKLNNRALIVYAAPAFETCQELYNFTTKGNIISQTAFPKISDLSGHLHWYYYNPRGGIACSEPTPKLIGTFFDIVEKYTIDAKHRYAEDEEEAVRFLSNNLKELSDTIVDVVNDDSNEDAQAQFFFSEIRSFERSYYNSMNTEHFKNPIHRTLVECFIKVSLFCEIYNLKWFTLI